MDDKMTFNEEQLKHLTDARRMAIDLKEDLLNDTDPDTNIIKYEKYILAIIFDQAIDNIDRKINT